MDEGVASCRIRLCTVAQHQRHMADGVIRVLVSSRLEPLKPRRRSRADRSRRMLAVVGTRSSAKRTMDAGPRCFGLVVRTDAADVSNRWSPVGAARHSS